ncbi:MAG: hypothetical protein QM703_19475 [Gemmatales bacterium]
MTLPSNQKELLRELRQFAKTNPTAVFTVYKSNGSCYVDDKRGRLRFRGLYDKRDFIDLQKSGHLNGNQTASSIPFTLSPIVFSDVDNNFPSEVSPFAFLKDVTYITKRRPFLIGLILCLFFTTCFLLWYSRSLAVEANNELGRIVHLLKTGKIKIVDTKELSSDDKLKLYDKKMSDLERKIITINESKDFFGSWTPILVGIGLVLLWLFGKPLQDLFHEHVKERAKPVFAKFAKKQIEPPNPTS